MHNNGYYEHNSAASRKPVELAECCYDVVEPQYKARLNSELDLTVRDESFHLLYQNDIRQECNHSGWNDTMQQI